MNSSLIVTYDSHPFDVPTLCVARQKGDKVIVLNTIQGDIAFGLYYYLTGYAEMLDTKEVPHKVVEVGKYGFCCPRCREDLKLGKEDIFIYDMPTPKYCEHCGQKLDWSDWK